ncbi:Alpha-L-fucosidase 2 [Dichanthelium oligosanthes]|uniref:Alpha-L-fucosidase 2 n=1 Tax=Dichanthelium oligosanthes TaxID=888268 RepID=A0A1E5VSR0_9POAL|nr:Alpha-L-fucosidase 2 [Dichanthelium oligosanthes]
MDSDGDCGSDAGAEWVWVRRPAEAETVAAAAGWPAAAADEEARPLKVVFASPATYFTDAAPIGNGRLGAMVWGGVESERLQLNHDTLWTGGPGNYTNPKAPAILSKVRSLVDNGKYPEATAAAYDLSGDQTQVYQPLGDIGLIFGKHIKYTNYKRELDLHTAIVNVTYTVGEVVHSREHFSSNPHQVIATKISANKPGNVSFTVSLSTPLDHKIRVTDSNEIIMEGSCPGKRPEDNNASDHPIGIKFCAILYLQTNGPNSTVEVLKDNMLKLDGADSVVLLLVAATSFEGPFTKPSESKLDPTVSAFKTLNIARSMSYSQLKAYHMDDYQSLFQRVSLQLSQGTNYQLGGNRPAQSAEAGSQDATISDYAFQMVDCTRSTVLNDSVKPTVDRIITFKDNEDPSLVELLFQFGRYLLISCSRPGTQISNLQGIWSNDRSPPWEYVFTMAYFVFSAELNYGFLGVIFAAPHPNINLQMNYWPALPCNLNECQEPLFDFIGSLSVNGAKTAKVCQLILGKSDTNVVQRIKKALPNLRPVKVARDGTIMEWAEEFQDPEVHHRHVSHLFGLYPGHSMSLEQTPDLCKAVANSLYKRDHQVVHVLMVFSYRFPTALSEMLLQSTGTDLYLLPALPRNKWPHGCVKGLKARGGVTVNISWKEGSLHEALLWSSSGLNSLARLHYGDKTATISLSLCQVYMFSRDLKCLKTWPL